ncbi:MAG: hypothetical protein ABF968_12220 [Acetobacter sp.]|uniref:hypothetical protein n=1 Tax=Acetobacter sp. TaxID=440 RepID=UPI0039EA93E0
MSKQYEYQYSEKLTDDFVSVLDGSLQPADLKLFSSRLATTSDEVVDSVASPINSVSGFGAQSGIVQNYTVANQLVPFSPEVSTFHRDAAILSTLIAASEAKRQIPIVDSANAAEAWQAIYANTFGGIGWVPQGQISDLRKTDSKGASVNEAIIEIIAAVSGGGAVLSLVKSVLSSLANTKQTDPFITLYERQVFKSNTVLLGVTIATGQNSGFLLQTYQFSFDVASADTSILVFKWHSANATVRYRRNDFSLAEAQFDRVKSKLSEIADRFVDGNVAVLSGARGP